MSTRGRSGGRPAGSQRPERQQRPDKQQRPETQQRPEGQQRPRDISTLSAEAQARIRAMQAIDWNADDEAFARTRVAGGAPAGGALTRHGAAASERDGLTDVPDGVRLQKVLAAAGVGSRRHCEELIGAGRVEVDGYIVRRFGARVDPQTQVIRIDGRRIPARQDIAYLAFNKPARVLTAMSDDRGRATITDYLGARTERLFHVGRLDYDTEGLMLLTNDGDLAHRLAHPRYEVLKTYQAEVPGPVPRSLGQTLARGVELEDGLAAADRFRVLDQVGSRALVEITLHEGRNHIVRRMLAEVGHPVSRLVRTDVGPVRLGNLRPGTTRDLTTKEIGELYAAVGL